MLSSLNRKWREGDGTRGEWTLQKDLKATINTGGSCRLVVPLVVILEVFVLLLVWVVVWETKPHPLAPRHVTIDEVIIQPYDVIVQPYELIMQPYDVIIQLFNVLALQIICWM